MYDDGDEEDLDLSKEDWVLDVKHSKGSELLVQSYVPSHAAVAAQEARGKKIPKAEPSLVTGERKQIMAETGGAKTVPETKMIGIARTSAVAHPSKRRLMASTGSGVPPSLPAALIRSGVCGEAAAAAGRTHHPQATAPTATDNPGMSNHMMMSAVELGGGVRSAHKALAALTSRFASMLSPTGSPAPTAALAAASAASAATALGVQNPLGVSISAVKGAAGGDAALSLPAGSEAPSLDRSALPSPPSAKDQWTLLDLSVPLRASPAVAGPKPTLHASRNVPTEICQQTLPPTYEARPSQHLPPRPKLIPSEIVDLLASAAGKELASISAAATEALRMPPGHTGVTEQSAATMVAQDPTRHIAAVNEVVNRALETIVHEVKASILADV